MKACFHQTMTFDSIEEVRAQIDRLDRQIVALLAERGAAVRAAARFKKTILDVKAPTRVEQVMTRVRALAVELGADVEVTEKVYRTLIDAFIEAEIQVHAQL